MSKGCAETTELRIRTSRCDDASSRCKGSSRPAQLSASVDASFSLALRYSPLLPISCALSPNVNVLVISRDPRVWRRASYRGEFRNLGGDLQRARAQPSHRDLGGCRRTDLGRRSCAGRLVGRPAQLLARVGPRCRGCRLSCACVVRLPGLVGSQGFVAALSCGHEWVAPMTIGKGWCVQVTAPPAPFQDRQCRSYPRPGVGTPSRGRAQAAPLKRRYSAGKQRRVNRSRSAIFPRSNLNGVWREVIGDRSDARCLCGASR